MVKSVKVGLFSGTFDPVHEGHVELARAARKAGGLEEVWLMVNPWPAHKSDVTAYEDRLAMAQLAVKEEQGLRVYEGALAGEPQVAATFEGVMHGGGDNEYVMVLGVDTLAQLDRWDDVESVVKNATYLAARRGDGAEEVVAALRERLGALGDDLRVRLFEFEPAAGASSAAIRAAVRAGERPAFLAPAVHAYILEKRLYS